MGSVLCSTGYLGVPKLIPVGTLVQEGISPTVFSGGKLDSTSILGIGFFYNRLAVAAKVLFGMGSLGPASCNTGGGGFFLIVAI